MFSDVDEQLLTGSHSGSKRSSWWLKKGEAGPWGDCQFSVVCRVRPVIEEEICSDIVIGQPDKTIAITNPYKNNSKIFTFHRIFDQAVKQIDFTKEVINQIFRTYEYQGKGSLVLSYGVTNSGKTYSILGTEEQPGILPVLIEQIEQRMKLPITITALQNYNDEFYSLKDKSRLYPKQNWGSYEFPQYNGELVGGQSKKDILSLFIKNRNQNDTKINKKSSRSHAIFKINCGRLSISVVDLAGSQRLNKIASNIQETTSINTSLLVLGKCLQAFKNGGIIPYRQSKLTRALMEFFGQDYKVVMIAHVNRSNAMFHQNLKVLEYAALSTKIKALNQNLNPSIMKSTRKRAQAKEGKSLIRVKNEQKSKSCTRPIKRFSHEKAHTELQSYQESTTLELQVRQLRHKHMQKLISELTGRNEQFVGYLQTQFEKEDEKDRKFLEELNSRRYSSPQKIMKFKTESKIKIRRAILEEIERERLANRIDHGTQIGESLRKIMSMSIKKQTNLEQQLHQQVVHDAGEQHKQQNIEPFNSQEIDINPSSQLSSMTPTKTNYHSDDSQSFMQRAIHNPVEVFKSGCKMLIKAANCSFRKIVDMGKIKLNEELLKQNYSRMRMKIVKEVQLVIQGHSQIDFRQAGTNFSFVKEDAIPQPLILNGQQIAHETNNERHNVTEGQFQFKQPEHEQPIQDHRKSHNSNHYIYGEIQSKNDSQQYTSSFDNNFNKNSEENYNRPSPFFDNVSGQEHSKQNYNHYVLNQQPNRQQSSQVELKNEEKSSKGAKQTRKMKLRREKRLAIHHSPMKFTHSPVRTRAQKSKQ